MTAIRASRWIILLGAFIASVTWSYIAIDHLLSSSLTPQQRVLQYGLTAQPQAVSVRQKEASQMQWGRQSLFSVACSFFMLLLVLMNWVLDGRQPRAAQKVI